MPTAKQLNLQKGDIVRVGKTVYEEKDGSHTTRTDFSEATLAEVVETGVRCCPGRGTWIKYLEPHEEKPAGYETIIPDNFDWFKPAQRKK